MAMVLRVYSLINTSQVAHLKQRFIVGQLYLIKKTSVHDGPSGGESCLQKTRGGNQWFNGELSFRTTSSEESWEVTEQS